MEMRREDLQVRMRRLDEDAALTFESAPRFRMLIVGGSALVLGNYRSRSTRDIDVLGPPKALVELMEKYDFNARAEAYNTCFPFNFEDRMVPLWSGEAIDFVRASLEDLVIAKLCAARGKDWEDIESEEVLGALNWALLDHLATDPDEAAASALNPSNYNDFLLNYHDYIKEHRPCNI